MSTPFEIRGHHLGSFADISSLQGTPLDIATSIVESHLEGHSLGPVKQAYSQDVIGTTLEEARGVKDKYLAAFNQYVDLEVDDPVVITVGERDSICRACVVGKHCLDRGDELALATPDGPVQIYANDIDDMLFIRGFKRLGDKLSQEGKIDQALGTHTPVSKELPRPSPNAIPILSANMIGFEVPILASAGYVKAVLRQWSMAHRLLATLEVETT